MESDWKSQYLSASVRGTDGRPRSTSHNRLDTKRLKSVSCMFQGGISAGQIVIALSLQKPEQFGLFGKKGIMPVGTGHFAVFGRHA